MEAGYLTMVEVLTVDFRTGQIEPHQVSFSRVNPKVFDLRNELLELFPGTEIKVKNQTLLLEEDQRLSEVVEAKAQLTALVKERMVRGTDEPDQKRAAVVNKTRGMVAIEDKKSNGLIYLGPDEISNDLKLEKRILSSNSFHVFRIKYEFDEVHRPMEVKKDGETVFSCFSYDLPKDENIENFVITVSNDEPPAPTLLKVMKNGDKKEIPSQGEPKDIMESEFYKPKDKIYRLSILNKTGEQVKIVHGRDSNFEIIPLPPTPENKVREVKESSAKAYRIGLVTEPSADADGYLTYKADMYRLEDGIKLLEIEPAENGSRKVMITSAKGERQELKREERKTYQEAKKTWMKILGKANKQPRAPSEADLKYLEANTKLNREQIMNEYNGFLKVFPAGEFSRDQVNQSKEMQILGSSQSLCNKAFGLLDTDKSGTIDFKEYMLLFHVHKNGSREDELKFDFQLIDKDGDATISFEEFIRFKKEMYSSWNEDVDMVKAEKEFAELDKDKNGLISLEEFLSADETQKKMKA